jgi:protein SCO1/2
MSLKTKAHYFTVFGVSTFVLAFALSSAAAPHGDNYTGKPVVSASTQMPDELQGIGIDEKLNTKLDSNLMFKDETGAAVTLGTYLEKGKPVVISPVYYQCPGLCNFHLNGFVDALKSVDWTIGSKFTYLAVSFDSKETPELAAAKKETYMKVYGRPEAESGWHFLTTDEANVQAITKALGFKFKWDEKGQQWAHSSAAIIITPDGVVSRYLPGIMYEPKDIKLALNEASAGKIGTIMDGLALYCFKYDPSLSKYTFYAHNIVKMGGAIMVLLLAIWLVPVWFRTRKESDKTARS